MKNLFNTNLGTLFVGGGILLAALTFSSSATAQKSRTSEAITHMPEQANGFLILNQVPNVSRWNIEISEISYDSTSTTNAYRFTLLEKIGLRGTNYMRIKPAFLNDGKYFLTVTGYNATNDEIVQEGPVKICNDCNSPVFACSWKCVGKTYAYGIDQWVNQDNSASTLFTTSVSPPQGSPYPQYYEWMNLNNWNALKNNPSNYSYYGLNANEITSFQTNSNPSINGNKIIKLENVPYNQLYDKDGFSLTGDVYGVAKARGPWQGVGSLSANTIQGQSTCNQNFNWAINTINANGQQFNQVNVPLLSCNGVASSPTNPSGGSGPYSDNPEIHSFIPCIQWFQDAYEGENGNLYVVLGQSGNCGPGGTPSQPNNPSPGAFVWPENVIAATIAPVSGGNSTVLKENTLFDADGNFIGDPIALDAGFYHIGLQFTDHSYASVFFERKTPVTSTLTHANFLNTNIYAVPIQGNSFTLELGATARVEFEYSLFDSNANLLHSSNYILEKNKQISELISVESEIPSGILINKFKFSDGSEITYQTVK